MTRMTPSEAFVETMVAHGVDTIFGIMGSAFMDAMDIFEPAGIELVPVVHEQGAAHMADGFSRVSGPPRRGDRPERARHLQTASPPSRPPSGPTARWWSSRPRPGPWALGSAASRRPNQLPMLEEFTKYQGHVNNEHRMAELTARCFDRALSEMGPTQINIPRDRFYGDIDVHIPTPQRLDRGPGGDRTLNEAAELLAGASFPVMISGGGVVMGDAMAETVALAERLGCPVVNSYLHNDSFPASHPLWCGPLGYQGSKAAMRPDFEGRCGAGPGAPGSARSARCPSTASTTGRPGPRSSRWTPTPRCSAWSSASTWASAATPARPRPRSPLVWPAGNWPATPPGRSGAAEMAGDKADWEAELDDWTEETDDFSVDMIKQAAAEHDNWMHPRQVLPRARDGDAAEGDGVHRHRQHQLRGQQLPALRGAPIILRGP